MTLATAEAIQDTFAPTLEFSQVYRLSHDRWCELCAKFCEELGFVSEINSRLPEDKIHINLRYPDRENSVAKARCIAQRSTLVGLSEVKQTLHLTREAGIENCILFCTSGFTPEAHAFCVGKAIELFSARSLYDKILSLPEQSVEVIEKLAQEIRFTAPLCPRCGKKMDQISAAVGYFWRCQQFPGCQFTYMQ